MSLQENVCTGKQKWKFERWKPWGGWKDGWSTDEENNKYPGESDGEMSSDSSDHDSDDSSILSNEPM